LFTSEFGYPNANANKRDLVGFRNVAAVVPNTAFSAAGTTYSNHFFVGSDTTDANLCVYHAAGGAVPTRIDLGPSFPTSVSGNWYRVRIEGNSSGMFYRVRNRSTGAVAEGTVTSNIPGLNALLTWNVASSRAGTSAVLDLGFVYFQMDFDLE
jgi:hypothetical protein